MSLNSNKNRLAYDGKTRYEGGSSSLNIMQERLRRHGGADQWTRMRDDKLRSLMRALYSSYQSSVIKFDNDDREYEFRCLINHDKLKVEYEDKIVSIPFAEIPENGIEIVDTGTPNEDDNTKYRVKSGDTFVWLSGNENYIPDSHWMIYLQYSEETAYFRGEIRETTDEIEINGTTYYGWSTGPNQQEIVWNVKKGIIWNDLNYTKLLYITKNQETINYLKRFDRIKLWSGRYKVDDKGEFVLDDNGEKIHHYDWWEIVGVNLNYGDGMARIAVKETYSNTPGDEVKVIKQAQEQEREIIAETKNIEGPLTIYPFDVVSYTAKYPIHNRIWSVDNNKVVKIIKQNENCVTIEVVTSKAYKQGFNLIYGDESLHIKINSL